MYRQVVTDVAGGNEVVYIPVGITGDVLKGGVACWFFVEPVNGHYWKNLIDGPAVGQRLKQGEVAKVLVRQYFGHVSELVRCMLHAGGNLVNVVRNGPEKSFHLGTGNQIKYTKTVAIEGFLPDLQGIVPGFEHAGLVHIVPQLVHLLHQLMVVFLNFFLVGPHRGRGSFQYFEDQYRMVGS